MTVCLQGGGEFSAGCRGMDRAVLALVDGPVVVTALAGAPGREYRTANSNGVLHYRALGADVVAAPDVREQPVEALEVLRTARLLVLPGGSPARLLTALRTSPVGALVRDLLASGGVVSGASAGAMVLCDWTVLPERRGPDGPEVARGLGVAKDLLVVPHWSGGSSRAEWLRAVRAQDEKVQVIGLPEEAGVLVSQDGVLTAVGERSTHLLGLDLDLAPGQTWRAVA